MTRKLKHFLNLNEFFTIRDSSRFLSFLETKSLPIFFILFTIALCILSLLTHWTFSETHPVHTASKLFGEYSRDFLFSLKPLYNLILFLSFKVSNLFSLFPMTVARLLFSLNGLLIAFLTWFILRKKVDSFSAALALLILISSPLFLERGFRVRSDLLATTLSLTSLAIAFLSKKQTNYALLLLSATLLITPKSIYWLIIVGLLLWNELPRLRLKKNILPVFSILSAVFLITGFVLKDPFFLMAINESASFYWSSLKDTWSFKVFPQAPWLHLPFFHISISIMKNPLLFCLPLLKGIFIFYRFFVLKQKKWNVTDVSFFCLCLTLVFHPYQKPFFICALQPFFILSFFMDPLWKKLSNHLFSTNFRVFLLSALYLFAVLMMGLNLSLIIKKNNNFLQKMAITKLNDFSSSIPNIKIYDPQALIFKGSVYQWYNKLYKEDKKGIKEKIVSHNIDIIYSLPYSETFDFQHWVLGGVGWLDIGNHLYYRSWQKELTESFKSLAGKKLIALLKADGFLDKKENIQKTYWYVFLNQEKIPFPKNKICPLETEKKPVLLPYCLYTEEEFLKGTLKNKPTGAKEIAVMYLPPIKDFPEEAFLNTLLRYDIFF